MSSINQPQKYEYSANGQRFVSENGIRRCNQHALAALLGVSRTAIIKWDEKIEKARLGSVTGTFPKSLKSLLQEDYKTVTTQKNGKTEAEYSVLAIQSFVLYYAAEADKRTDQAFDTLTSMTRLGADVFIGRMAGDPIAVGDAGNDAIAEMRTQLVVAAQKIQELEEHIETLTYGIEAYYEHVADQREEIAQLSKSVADLSEDVEQADQYAYETSLQAQADREYSNFLARQLEQVEM